MTTQKIFQIGEAKIISEENLEEKTLDIKSTFTPEELRGQGIAGKGNP